MQVVAAREHGALAPEPLAPFPGCWGPSRSSR
jgi:hypothetical protein